MLRPAPGVKQQIRLDDADLLALSARFKIDTGNSHLLSARCSMRTVTGAILLFAAEQSYAHACLIPFPHQESSARVLLPASCVLLVVGLTFLVWGLLTETVRTRPARSR